MSQETNYYEIFKAIFKPLEALWEVLEPMLNGYIKAWNELPESLKEAMKEGPNNLTNVLDIEDVITALQNEVVRATIKNKLRLKKDD